MDVATPRTRFAEVNGTKLAYVEQGHGEAVVFVHGGISDWRTWTAQLKPFAEAGFRAVAYSRRFHWPNPPIRSGERSLVAAHADDLARFIEEMELGPANLVGNSWGALVALRLAKTRPELVGSLILEEPPAFGLVFSSFPPKPAALLKLLLTRPRLAGAIIGFGARTAGPATKLLAQGDVQPAVERFARGVLGAKVYQAAAPERKQQMRDNASEFAASFPDPSFDHVRAEDVRTIEATALLVLGEKSPAFLRRLLLRLAALLPHASVARIESASHLMHEERPDATNAAMLRFLKARPRGTNVARAVAKPIMSRGR